MFSIITDKDFCMRFKQGFTLIELAIALVITGLLIGGILVAQSMIATTKVQRLIRTLQQYEIATNNFKSTYKYYPGDDAFFEPAGNKDQSLGFGAAGDNVSCNGIYNNFGGYQSFSHLSQANMFNAKFLPFSPSNVCGGTQSDDYYKDLGGISAPYTELSAKAAAAWRSPKLSLSLGKGAGAFLSSNPYIYFLANAEDVAPLEIKLGTTTMSNPVVGILNESGAGQCSDSDVGSLPCTDASAVYTSLMYFFPAI